MPRLEKVRFTFSPESFQGEIKHVGIVGTFLFYNSNLTGNTCETGMGDNKEFFPPHMYKEGMERIGMGCYEEMELCDGVYTVEFMLPPGLYNYRFAINAELEEGEPDFRSGRFPAVGHDGKMHVLSKDTVYLPDPANPPLIPTVTGAQAESVRVVGTCADLPWLPGVPEEKRGAVTYVSYTDVDGRPQSLGVHLPAGYDRTKTYPAVFVSHGGGGNEADWFHQGGIHWNMDTLIAEGKTEEAILVTMNNSVYGWDFEKIAKNLYECVIPFVRKLFPVSCDPMKNAFCGLSMGSMTTLYMYMHHNTAFHYYGAFSGGIAGGEHFSLDDPNLMQRMLMIGCAEEDIAWNFREIGVPPTIDELEKKGVPHVTYFVPGGHDWYCWPQMFTEFAKNILWK